MASVLVIIVANVKFVSAGGRNQHAGSVRSPDIGTPRPAFTDYGAATHSEAATEFTWGLREVISQPKPERSALHPYAMAPKQIPARL